MKPVATLLLTAIWTAAAGFSPARGADYPVNDLGDAPDLVLDGVCDVTPGSHLCTLRAAAMEAGASGAADEVLLPAGEIVLVNGPLPDLTAASGPLTLRGAGRNRTLVRSDPDERQHFVVNNTALALVDLELRGFASWLPGGAVRSTGALDVARCRFTGNASDYHGGAIYSTGTLDIEDALFANGTAGFDGGEIASTGGFACLRCVFAAASAGRSGGAVWHGAGFATVRDSLFADNSAGSGGAIHVATGAELALVNSTLSGNSALGDGGAVEVHGFAEIASSTVAFNLADADLDGGEGGGVFAGPGSNGTWITDSILAANQGSVYLPQYGNWLRWPQDCAGDLATNGHNVVRANDEGLCHFVAGTPPSTADPLLQPLDYQGGPTRTHALASGSPAIDAGNPGGCSDGAGGALDHDQRGALRPIGAHCDLGAFERGPLLFGDDFELGEWRWSAVVP